MTHTQKLRMARDMMTFAERQKNVSPWDSAQWNFRKQVLLRRIIRFRMHKTSKAFQIPDIHYVEQKGFIKKLLGK